jgi:DNA-binding response OmpR family regulator
MISAYGDYDAIATALECGADKFLTKPVDFPELKRGIRAVIAGDLQPLRTSHVLGAGLG